MPTTIVAGNWKMNTTLDEAKRLVSAMKSRLDAVRGVEKVVCPPFVSLAAVSEALRGSSVKVGAQNLYPEEKGAFTGEISPAMLKPLCDYVILGHSERRQLLGETDDFVNRKVVAALQAGLRPILCVGEQLPDREAGNAEAVVEKQLRGSLREVKFSTALAVAYEPVWAIGTGRAATPDVAQGMMAHMRGVLASVFGKSEAAGVSLLYGGSVNPANVSDFMRQQDINGALVGGASLDANSFSEIAEKAAQAKS
ncbi:MAG: triose-phosphate isomerase [Chloroflexi bacterium]|nr:triose-phosphate isomerase [Chloroflexota bacterium]